MVEVKIGIATVRIFPDAEYLETTYPGGLKVSAAPNRDNHSIQLAQELGYSSTWRMSMDHEILHSLLAVAQGLDRSPTLYGVALHDAGKGKYAPRHVWAEEEARVLSCQAYLADGKLRPELAGLNMGKVKARLLEIRRACGV